MADFLVKYGAPGQTPAQAEAGVLAVASKVQGLTTGGVLNEGVGHWAGNSKLPTFEWAITVPFQQMHATGATTTDGFGNTVPVMASDGYWYRVFRWNGDLALFAPYLVQGGATISTDAQTGTITVTAGPVTMIAPPPPGTQMSF